MNGPDFKTRQGGFTLAELLVVIVIIGILAVVVMPQFTKAPEKAKVAAALAQIRSLENALEMYYADLYRYPTTEQGLRALITAPGGEGAARWDGSYLRSAEVPLDPWRNPYVYLSPGQKNSHYDIISYGADGVPGGSGVAADITN